MPLDDCKLLFVNEVFSIEKPGTQINEFDDTFDPSASPVKSRLTYYFDIDKCHIDCIVEIIHCFVK